MFEHLYEKNKHEFKKLKKKSKMQKLYKLLAMKYTSFTTTDTLLSKQKTQKMTRDRSEFELSPS